MTIIYCTQKLRKELGVEDSELAPKPEISAGVGNWYANLLRFGPKKCVLFINEKTCYAVVALEVHRPEIRALDKLLLDRLPLVMRSNGFSDKIIEKAVAEHSEFAIGKASDKKILGYLTDLGKQLRFAIEDPRRVSENDEVEQAKCLNDIPLLSFDGATGEYLFSILLTGGIRNADNDYKRKIVSKYREKFHQDKAKAIKVVQFPQVWRGRYGPTLH